MEVSGTHDFEGASGRPRCVHLHMALVASPGTSSRESCGSSVLNSDGVVRREP